MKLGEIKEYAMQLCEEYQPPTSDYDENTSGYNFTLDIDYSGKMTVAINNAIADVARICPIISREVVYPISEEVALPTMVKSVKRCEVNGKSVPYLVCGDTLKFAKSYPEVEITFERMPRTFFASTPNSEKMEFSDDVCSTIIYGVCADILKVSGNYELFEAKYQARLATLAPQKKITFVSLHGGSRI